MRTATLWTMPQTAWAALIGLTVVLLILTAWQVTATSRDLAESANNLVQHAMYVLHRVHTMLQAGDVEEALAYLEDQLGIDREPDGESA